jgi:hypothetical protein
MAVRARRGIGSARQQHWFQVRHQLNAHLSIEDCQNAAGKALKEATATEDRTQPPASAFGDGDRSRAATIKMGKRRARALDRAPCVVGDAAQRLRQLEQSEPVANDLLGLGHLTLL